MKKLVLARRFSQIFFLLLFVYILWTAVNITAFFKIDPLLSALNPLALTMLILTFIFGRFFCGWVCPLGTIIDTCGIKSRNRGLSFLTQVKYYVLGFIVIFSFLGIQIQWVFDPLVITARFISLNFVPSFTFALDRSFIFLIKTFNFYTPLYDFYRILKSSILGSKVYYFQHTFINLSLFVLICCLVVITKRFWCRAICPAGAIYSIISRYSLLTRVVNRCVNCMECEPNCRMSAIKKDMSYAKAECILCMDCIYDCPTHATRFTFFKKAKGKKSWGFAWPARQTKIQTEGSISRKEFLLLITSSFLLLGFRNRAGLGFAGKKLIRPPGVNNEREFLSKCVRCGNCMRACPTNGLQPVIFELGFSGIWTPHLVPEIGYCEYNCNLCGNVCPTGAIPRLTLAVKKEQKLGYAVIDKDICLPWSQNKECIVCEEHCPVATKAIKTYDEVFKDKKIKKPYVDVSLCIGCGICQNKCPTRPVRAVKVSISTR